MTERRNDPFQEDAPLADSEEGYLPNVDLQLGGDEDLAGSGEEGLAELDEENLYGNDVIVECEFDDAAQRNPTDR
jgi:hypothetical protein